MDMHASPIREELMASHNENNMMISIVMEAVEEDERAMRMEEHTQITSRQKKCKEKVLSTFSFNNDGLFSPAAIRILEERNLKSYSKEFGKVVIDMDAMTGKGGSVKDVLEDAILGSLESLEVRLPAAQGKGGPLMIFDPVVDAEDQVAIPLAGNPSLTGYNNDPNTDLMEAEEVLLEMARYEELEMKKMV